MPKLPVLICETLSITLMGKEKGPATLTVDFFQNNEIKFPDFKMKMKIKIAIFAPEVSHYTEFLKKLLSDLAKP
jgi:hypothetical protein